MVKPAMSRAGWGCLVLLVGTISIGHCADDERGLRITPKEALLKHQQENWLVAIGVERFQDTSVSPLQFCVEDAQGVYAFFVSTGLATKSQAYLVMTDAADPRLRPTRRNLLKTVQYVCRQATEDSTILISFSGHGFMGEDGESYLLPEDGEVSLLNDTAVSVSRLNEMLASAKAKRKILFIDACRNSPLRDSKGASAARREGFNKALGASDGQIILAACGKSQVSYEMPEARHGVFTYHLLQGLRGAAETDEDGFVNLSTLHAYLSKAVPRWCKSQLKQVQQPWLHGDMSVPIPLSIVGEKGKPATALVLEPRPLPPAVVQQPTLPALLNPLVTLKVEEKPAVGALAGKAEPVFRRILASGGIRIQDGDTDAEGVQPTPDYRVTVAVNYDIRTRRILDTDADNLQLTVSVTVRAAQDGKILTAIAPKSLAKNYFIPKRMNEDVGRVFEKAAAETVKALKH